MIKLCALLLVMIYIVNSRLYIMILNKIFEQKYSRWVYELLVIGLSGIVIIKQFVKLNNSYLPYITILMLLYQVLSIVFCYKGTLKRKVISFSLLYGVYMLIDIFVVGILYKLILHMDIHYLSRISIQNVTMTAISSFISIIIYILFCQHKRAELPKSEYKEIYILSILNLVIIMPSLIFLNDLNSDIRTFKQDLGILVLVQILVISLILCICVRVFKHKNANIENLQKEIEYYNSIGDTVEELHKLRHDMNNHFASVTALMNLGQYDTVKEYLNKICDDVQDTKDIALLDDKLLSIILTDKFRKAKSLGIQTYKSIMASDYFYQFLGQMQDTDKTALFGNILDNAVRAASEGEVPKKLSFEVKASDCEIEITCRNSKPEGLLQENRKGLFRTTKKEPGHGLGMGIIQETTWKYGGSIDYKVENDMFTLNVSFTRKGGIE